MHVLLLCEDTKVRRKVLKKVGGIGRFGKGFDPFVSAMQLYLSCVVGKSS
jgi:hypothetical protein